MAKKEIQVFRGRRKRLNVLGIALSALAVCVVALIVVFYSFQKYIVYSQDGIRLELPILATPAPVDEGGARVFEAVEAALSFAAPDYSGLEATAGEGLGDLRAVFVPAAEVSAAGVAAYTAFLETYNANALVLEVKPVDGQLVWASGSAAAQAYGTGGQTDLAALAEGLKAQGLYLVAQLNCFADALLAGRATGSALRAADGSLYADGDGAWLDPYDQTVRDYIAELCLELDAMGFDEVLLRSVNMPITDQALRYSVDLSYTPTPVTAVCGFARGLTQALADTDLVVSAMLDSQSFRNGQSAVSGQDLTLFGKVFDRLYCSAGTAWQYTVDRDSAARYLELGELARRFVPIMAYAPEEVTSYVVRVPEALMGG